MSLRSIAAEFGVTHQTLMKAIKSGTIKATPETITSAIVADSEWNRSRKGKPVTAPKVTKEPTEEQKKAALVLKIKEKLGVDAEILAQDKNTLEKLLILERRRSLQLDNEEREGNLLNADEVLGAWSKIISATRSTLLLLPAKLSHKLSAISDPSECGAVLDAAIKEGLKSLSEYQLDVA